MFGRIAETRAGLGTRWLALRRRARALAGRHHAVVRPRAGAAALLVLATTLPLGIDAIAARERADRPQPRAATEVADALRPRPRRTVEPAPDAALPALSPPTTAAPAPPPAVPETAIVQTSPSPTPIAVPAGKGMWIWLPEYADGGDPAAIVGRALATGLTHIYVRTGSSWQGFHGAPFLDAILPAAHAAGLRVYGWDFPSFTDPGADVARAVAAIGYATPDGHRIDGFSPDIETPSEGTHIEHAVWYAYELRAAVGDGYPLIATVPRPSAHTLTFYPYAELLPPFDAVAPMVYWLNRQPDEDVAGALQFLGQFGKPVLPVGQAYDGAPEGGRPGPPTPDEISRFIVTASQWGATGISFWSWQHSTQEIWDTIAGAAEFAPPPPPPPPPPPEPPLSDEQRLTTERLLTSLQRVLGSQLGRVLNAGLLRN